MGTTVSTRLPDYEVSVKTGDVKGAGTDANVYIALVDEKGRKSRDVLLDCKWRDDFEKGSTDVFKIRNIPQLEKISRIEIWRDNKGLNDDWFVEWIKVKCTKRVKKSDQGSANKKKLGNLPNEEIPFPCNRWIKEHVRFILIKYDSILPQFDDRKQQRKDELQMKREKFIFQEKAPGLPRQVKDCPAEESFSNDYKWDITSRKMKLLAHRKITKITSSYWQKIEDMDNVYKGPFQIPYVRMPTGYYNWKSDEQFGRQRLTGVNPNLIVRCKEIPSKLAVTSEMLEPFLDGMSLDEAVNTNSIYMVDLKVLHNLECHEGRVLCAPIALFHAKKDGKVMPIAIQLFQEPGEENPVFLPSDPQYTWMLAKMYYNNADAALHQACTHLGFTHMICETICVSVNRELSPSHPIYRLLAPHFLYLIAINSLALAKLVSPGGWIDITMTTGVKGLFAILKATWKEWQMNEEGWLPNDLKNRGVDDTDALPDYPYRDDAVLIHQAINNYVKDIVNYYYPRDDMLVTDYELQSWAQTLVDCEKGCCVKGVPGDGKFEKKDDLIKVLTSIIFLSSVGHASANFNQYDEYAFPPNYPAILRGDIPKTKEPLTEAGIINHLPSKDTTLSIMVVTKILSDRGTNGLGDFEIQYMYEPQAVEAVEKFRKELKNISAIIGERNKVRAVPYPYLDPKEVPNAIRASTDEYFYADHFWPLNGNAIDKVEKVEGSLHHAEFITNGQLGGAASLNGAKLQWIDFESKSFKGIYLATPAQCPLGLSIGFWIRFRRGKYILSTGASTILDEGTGFQITYEEKSGQFTAFARTTEKVWKTGIKAQFNTWCYLMLTWSESKGLRLYLDAKQHTEDVAGSKSTNRAKRLTHMLTIGSPPNLDKKTEYGTFDMAHLSIWHEVMSEDRIIDTPTFSLTNSKESDEKCKEKQEACRKDSCGHECLEQYRDAVCVEFVHIPCQDKSYMKASNYYRLLGNILRDIRGQSKVRMLPRGFSVNPTKQLGDVVSLNGRDERILIDRMQESCITKTDFCPKGLSVGFWLRLKGGRYIMSAGLHGDNLYGGGFKIYEHSNKSSMVILVSTGSEKWTAYIHKLPIHNKWLHFLFTWNRNEGLKIFIDGVFALEGSLYKFVNTKLSPASKPSGISIGEPDTFEQVLDFGHFDIGHLAVWEYALTKSEVAAAYKTSIHTSPADKQCCNNKLQSPCTRDPCTKFRSPTKCSVDLADDSCLCPVVEQPATCRNARNGRVLRIILQHVWQDRFITGTVSFHLGRKKSDKNPMPTKSTSGEAGKNDMHASTIQSNYHNNNIGNANENDKISSEYFCGKTNPYDKAEHLVEIENNKIVHVRKQRKNEIISSDNVIQNTNQLGAVLSMKDNFIDMKGFEKECLTDPNECESGLSIGFWLHLVKAKYILTGGSYADEPRGCGFKIYQSANATQLRVEIATTKKKWVAVLHKVPKNWFYFLLSWSSLTNLRIFINGVFVLNAGSQNRIIQTNNNIDNRVFIAKQDLSQLTQQSVQFDIGKLAVWYETFKDSDVSKAYQMSIMYNTKSKECCLKKEQSECYLNPCYKFKVNAQCEINCICPKVEPLRRCTHRKFIGECVDKRSDCKVLASQNGYCDFYEKDMENLCPTSCRVCVPKKASIATRSTKKMKKEVVIFLTIGCGAGIVLLLLIALYSWKVYRSKFTGAFIPSFKTETLLEAEEYGDEKWTKKYIDSSYFVIKDVPPKKRALPVIPSKPAQPKYQPPEF
eukprot:gene3702-4222_t